MARHKACHARPVHHIAHACMFSSFNQGRGSSLSSQQLCNLMRHFFAEKAHFSDDMVQNKKPDLHVYGMASRCCTSRSQCNAMTDKALLDNHNTVCRLLTLVSCLAANQDLTDTPRW